MMLRKGLLFLLTVTEFIPPIKTTICQMNCKYIWYDGQPKKELFFYQHETSTLNDSTSSMHWQWSTSLTDKWTVYYKEWPRKAAVTGGFVFSDRWNVMAKLSWKLSNGILLWTTVYKRPFSASWNGTICNSNLPMQLDSKHKRWVFNLGGVEMVGGKSGRKILRESSIMYKAFRVTSNRTKRRAEEEEMDEEKRETTWKKIKGWFRELFDQSDHDDRGWLTRISDWMLGFLKRVLT